MNYRDVVILGAGIAGLSVSHFLCEKGINSIILEKNNDYGGLCNSFSIDGFTFDTFAHISFDNDPETYALLEGRTAHRVNKPEALNYCDGIWVRNPVQNNLVELPVDERIRIIQSFIDRRQCDEIRNYGEWLDCNFGTYFSHKYPYRYTHKYWTLEPSKMDYRWISGRMNTLDIEGILRSAMESNEETLHYSKEARYPTNGGFKAFLKPFADSCDIIFNACVKGIDIDNKCVVLTDGRCVGYSKLVSTIPLTEIIRYLKSVPREIAYAVESLDYTSGAMISLGFNRPCVSPSLWFYIYDEDIYPARVYSPDWKSPNNVPNGCSAIQAEVYFSKYRPLNLSLDELKELVITQLLKLNLFTREDIVVSDVRYMKYANIIFTPKIYEARQVIHQFLDGKGIVYAGRWGEWDYLWVGQSLRSGRNAANKVVESL